MKIYLTKDDVRKILADHFDLKTIITGSAAMDQGICLVHDELYWEGNEENKGRED